MDGTNIASGTIPVGIAVARQRLQETAQATSPILKPDISRYGIGLGDLTGAFLLFIIIFIVKCTIKNFHCFKVCEKIF